jgi:hypothetical protein
LTQGRNRANLRQFANYFDPNLRGTGFAINGMSRCQDILEGHFDELSPELRLKLFWSIAKRMQLVFCHPSNSGRGFPVVEVICF